MTDLVPFVIWAPRSFNSPPDHLCNAAMDEGADWEWRNEPLLSQSFRSKACFKICVDGGLRAKSGDKNSEQKAAMGVAIYCKVLDGTNKTWNYVPVFFSATRLWGVASAFHCEACALERAFDKVMRFCV